jgi:hypothetical protein
MRRGLVSCSCFRKPEGLANSSPAGQGKGAVHRGQLPGVRLGQLSQDEIETSLQNRHRRLGQGFLDDLEYTRRNALWGA